MTHSRQAVPFRQALQQALPGLAGVVAITTLCFPLHLEFAIVGCFYLLLVVLRSASASFASSAVVSLAAIACLDYFFVPPILTWNLSQPLDGLALLTFLATALIVTRLASRAREQARIATDSRKDLARLYELALRLVSIDPAIAVGRQYLGIFQDVFHLRAVSLFDSDAASLTCEGYSHHHLGYLTKGAYISGRDYSDEEGKLAVLCFRIEGRLAGAIGFEGLHNSDATAGPLSILAAAMVQRARSFEAASAASAATQVEVLRSAILDAFAHQFKTPLAAILTAAGGLRETGPLTAPQAELAETIETQAAGLGHLTSRLLRIARLDRDEITPRLQRIDLAALARRIATQYNAQIGDRAFALDAAEKQAEVLADPEMLGLAIAQLLDNAFRYSPPVARVTLTVNREGDQSVIRVANEGSAILPQEQSRIFERFYRGSAGNQTSGTGLGLYVARKIVTAHGGALELDTAHRCGPETTFYLRLSVAK